MAQILIRRRLGVSVYHDSHTADESSEVSYLAARESKGSIATGGQSESAPHSSCGLAVGFGLRVMITAEPEPAESDPYRQPCLVRTRRPLNVITLKDQRDFKVRSIFSSFGQVINPTGCPLSD